MAEEADQSDICRVCRSEGSPDRPLFHPCICTGSIKYIHQECLLVWLRYSKKEFCELCNHRFTFQPIYAPDMPKHLPIRDILSGLLKSAGRGVASWFHYTLVAMAWLGLVPLTAGRMYRALFSVSGTTFWSLPMDMVSTENLVSDIIHGCLVMSFTLCAFISLVWLREQIVQGGGPEWLDEGRHEVRRAAVPANDEAHVAEEEDEEEDEEDLTEDEDAENRELGMGHEEGEPDPHFQLHVQGVAPQAPPPPDVFQEGNIADDLNWNPLEWERAAEELTWERLLGLDGSLVFLEHVFWVISLNGLFVFVFAFCPYHIGKFALVPLGLDPWLRKAQFPGFLATLAGYLIVGTGLALAHWWAKIFRFRRPQRLFGLGYVVIKVAILSVCEIGLFPVLCGWWIDVCSLALLETSLKERLANFIASPGTSMFLHWMLGMGYIFYMANLIILLREVLRPGVLWFLRNLNDPDFNPIQEMIHLPVTRHVRRFMASFVIFGFSILLELWIPITAIKLLIPGFLPYSVSMRSEVPVSELSLELLFLQVILPALLEQGHIRSWIVSVIRAWCRCVAWTLGITDYLLGGGRTERAPTDPAAPLPPVPNEEEGQGDQQAPLPAGPLRPPFPPPLEEDTDYFKPPFFSLRIAGLLVAMAFSCSLSSFVLLSLPVALGRMVICLWVTDVRLHECYTMALGLYLIWLVVRLLVLVSSWTPLGWNAVTERLKNAGYVCVKAAISALVLCLLIPMMLGLLFQLILMVPVRVPLHQTPLFFLWQDWALGVLYTKLAIVVTFMGPTWWLKQALEQVYNDGVRNLDLGLVLFGIALPVLVNLGSWLAIPYILAHSVGPLLTDDAVVLNRLSRRIYPSLFLLALVAIGIHFQWRQFKRLYEHIKNERYLVGRRLVNYHHHRQQRSSA